EPELFLRSRRDGEYCLRVAPQDDGITRVRIVEPEFIRCPDGSIEYSFGIYTPLDDREHIEKYFISYTGNIADGHDVDPDEILFTKLNVDRSVKRGISDLFSVHELVENCKKLLRAELIGETCRSSIPYIKQFSEAAQQTVQTLVTADTD